MNGQAILDRVHNGGNAIEGLTPAWIRQSAIQQSSGVRKRVRNLKRGVRKRPIPGFCQKAFLFNHNFDAFEGFSAA